MNRLIRLWATEPAVIVGAVVAILGLAASLGLLVLTDSQMSAISTAVTAIGALLASFVTRTQVTPADKPG